MSQSPLPATITTASTEGPRLSPDEVTSAVAAPARLVAVEAVLTAAPLPSAELQSIVSVLRHTHGALIAAVSIVTPDRQTYLAIEGLDTEYTEVRDEVSFCAHVVAGGQPLAVADALHDARFAPNPYVADRIIASYVGVPVCDDEGLVLGSLCLYSATAGAFDASLIPVLTEQAAIVSVLLRSITPVDGAARPPTGPSAAGLPLATPPGRPGTWHWVAGAVRRRSRPGSRPRNT